MLHPPVTDLTCGIMLCIKIFDFIPQGESQLRLGAGGLLPYANNSSIAVMEWMITAKKM